MVVPVAIWMRRDASNYPLLSSFILSFISIFFVPSFVITFSGGLSALSVGH